MEGGTIRFKLGDVEFELSGSAADVAKAWDALGDRVVAAFADGPAPAQAADGPGKGKARRKQKKPSGAGGEAKVSDTRQKLMDAKLDEFPEVGDEATALIGGYAVLSWAREKLGIKELTAADIHAVRQGRLRVPATAEAYRWAFRQKPQAVHKTTKKPATYELMKPGDKALEAYLKSVADGKTPAEAGEKAEQAEAKAG